MKGRGKVIVTVTNPRLSGKTFLLIILRLLEFFSFPIIDASPLRHSHDTLHTSASRH